MDVLIQAKNIKVDYMGKEILDIEDLNIYSYDRIGLVGENGCGKTTLLKLLTGRIKRKGCIVKCSGSISYISQLKDSEFQSEADKKVMSKLEIKSLNREFMSGGEETRLKIASAFSNQKHAIFADEPTCHLDKKGINLLLDQLKAFDGTIFVISHDRYFLDAIVDKIWELKDGKIKEYWGNYSDYFRQKEEDIQYQKNIYEKVTLEKEKLNRAIQERRNKADSLDKKNKTEAKSRTTESAGRLGNQKTTGSKQKKLYQAAKSMEKRMDALDEISVPEKTRSIQFRKSKALELYNKFPIIGSEINLSYGDRTIFENASFTIPLQSKVAFTGINGSGKTSLFKMIMDHSEGITVSPKASIGYFEQISERMRSDASVISYIQHESDYKECEIRSVLASMNFKHNEIEKAVSVLSGGEVVKLKLTKLLLGRYNILLMDEPGNYLDILSLEALEKMLKEYSGTILFITHDQMLMDHVADMVYEVGNRKIIQTK